ncbi:cytochrome P450 monooxygenase-like protein [Plenodomus tracheiphilus IPT5]|uniref:Cytochrome P450 monooxygenase-like protein n=1 Tax=Plenodomus tracheiphilus IPT5 TaxID=1408161 RepID=A0A6A7BA24_9PLEO|nr:cytochrome P450 monooxygenase-like protein [Plenodomus tracheiphilus IPT5]
MMLSLLQVFVLGFAILFLYMTINAIQRLFFHPLKGFPGPKLSAASRIPWNIATWTGTRNLALRAMHAKYGHIVRINPNELSFTHPDAWKDIYGHGTKNTQGTLPHKDWAKYGKGVNGAQNLLNARSEDHGRMRKIFNPAFSDRALKQQEPLFLKYIDLLVSKLKDGLKADPEMKWDMVRMYNFTTFDVMGDITFGEPLHMLDNAEYDPWVQTIFASLIITARMGILMEYTWFWSMFRTVLPQLNRRRLAHFSHSVDRVTKRLEKGRVSDGVDLWDLVLEQKEGKGLSRKEMDSNAALFMVAGTETTATLVSGLTFYLLSTPESMRKLTEEIRGTFSNDGDMTMEKLAALPYLNACIKETFRVYPPVPLIMPRCVPEDGSTIVGQFIPPGTSVGIPQHATFTHPRNFKMPMEYIPERWLGDKRFEGDQRSAVQPFSVGTRDCLGKNMAHHEMRLLIAKVLYNFDLELCPESKDWSDQRTFILWQKKPLMCKLTAVR